MKFAIIAAGEGSRLATEGISAPKPLVEIKGEKLIDRLIRIFLNNGASEVWVICNSLTTLVDKHLLELEAKDSRIKHIVRTTDSSMHSFHALSPMLKDEPFILTTVDTIFNEKDFERYIEAFNECLKEQKADGMMGMTDYIDDEKPLYIKTSASIDSEFPRITAFLDADEEKNCKYISAGIYGLTPKAITTLQRCIDSGSSRMRNFQRALLTDCLHLKGFPFSKVLDIDHASDIAKAESFLGNEE